jgi:hypothetical protein
VTAETSEDGTGEADDATTDAGEESDPSLSIPTLAMIGQRSRVA